MYKSRSLATAVLVGMSASACYGYYAPVTADLRGRDTRVSLTDSGSVILAPRVGQGIAAIEGRIVADSADAYNLAITTTIRSDGQEFDWKGERVMVPHALVSKVEERRFSSARTSVFTFATAAALIAAKAAFSGFTGSNAPGGTPGGPGGGK